MVEYRMKRRIRIVFVALILTVITIFLSIEMRSYHVISSTICKNPAQTEVQLYVQINTFFGVDSKKISEEIILEHQRINGELEQASYILHLYRTGWHYRKSWEYDTIICDENGAIICCKEELRKTYG